MQRLGSSKAESGRIMQTCVRLSDNRRLYGLEMQLINKVNNPCIMLRLCPHNNSLIWLIKDVFSFKGCGQSAQMVSAGCTQLEMRWGRECAT